jgi:hypothetical protein
MNDCNILIMSTPHPSLLSHPPPEILFLFSNCLLLLFCYFLLAWENTCDNSVSESVLFHLTWWFPIPSIFLQMTCHSSLWFNNIYSNIHIYIYVPHIYIYMYICIYMYTTYIYIYVPHFLNPFIHWWESRLII